MPVRLTTERLVLMPEEAQARIVAMHDLTARHGSCPRRARGGGPDRACADRGHGGRLERALIPGPRQARFLPPPHRRGPRLVGPRAPLTTRPQHLWTGR